MATFTVEKVPSPIFSFMIKSHNVLSFWGLFEFSGGIDNISYSKSFLFLISELSSVFSDIF